MTVMICRECGHHSQIRSDFERECTECGSEDLELEDAYDPQEHELQCEFCGFSVDTTARDSEWVEDGEDMPTSVDDPCPRCESALVPRGEARNPRAVPEYKMAVEAARRLHREYEIAGPPYELESLARKLGLEVVVAAFRHEGLLVGERIEIPEHLIPEARRFSLAHEIAHFVLRHEGERSKIEGEANAFASEMLIPRTELQAQIAANPSMRGLRRHFGVSGQAITYALMSAGALGRVRR
ncbi:MAG: hypothetical protein QOI84_822 [Solirubrobacterales bacterium]|jgi:ribosomal protein L37E|nr:hypothetical protein [Solirubrobacterales bacterium]